MWNISFVPNARNLSMATAITSGRGWPIAKLTTTNFLATCAMFAIKSFRGMCSLHSTKLGKCNEFAIRAADMMLIALVCKNVAMFKHQSIALDLYVGNLEQDFTYDTSKY